MLLVDTLPSPRASELGFGLLIGGGVIRRLAGSNPTAPLEEDGSSSATISTGGDEGGGRLAGPNLSAPLVEGGSFSATSSSGGDEGGGRLAGPNPSNPPVEMGSANRVAFLAALWLWKEVGTPHQPQARPRYTMAAQCTP